MSEKEKESFLAKWAMSALIPKMPQAASQPPHTPTSEAQTEDIDPVTHVPEDDTDRVEPEAVIEALILQDQDCESELHDQTPSSPPATESEVAQSHSSNPQAPDEALPQPSLIPHHDLITSRAKPGQRNNPNDVMVLCCGNNNYEQVATPN